MKQTPKEKAKELVSKMLLDHDMPYDLAQECALIAVDEILNLNFNIKCDATEKCVNPVMNYWQEVKSETEKL